MAGIDISNVCSIIEHTLTYSTEVGYDKKQEDISCQEPQQKIPYVSR